MKKTVETRPVGRLSSSDPEHAGAGGLATGALLLLPGALVVYFGFTAGGFFPGATGVAAVVVALILIVRIMLAPDPFSGLSMPLTVAVTACALFTLWTLVSGSWSESESRAIIEFDRALLYTLILALFGLVPRTPRRMRLALWGLAGALVIVCGAGFVSRTFPEIVSTTPDLRNSRLSFPVTYWNALGLLAAIGIVLSFHLSSSEREPMVARVLGAAALPLLGATLTLTFSRGGIAAALIGLAVYSGIARNRALLPTLLVVGTATAVAVVSAYDADLLATEDPTTAAAVDQGARLALVTVAAMLGAALARLALIPVDRRLPDLALPRWAMVGALSVLLAVGAAAFFVQNGPGWISTQYDGFVGGSTRTRSEMTRDRLGDLGNRGRLALWRVAVDQFQRQPLRGRGAGTFQTAWARERTRGFIASDAHSLYLEVLAELGIVGSVLLAVTLSLVLGALAFGARGRQRALYAAPLAGALAWCVHAGVDWDWEMPVLTAWVFALGGLALARTPDPGPTRAPSRLVRAAVSLGLFLVAITPGLVALSQHHLNESVQAFQAGDCDRSIKAARDSARFASFRPEPQQMLGFCDARRGRGPSSIAAMRDAIERDPANWEFRYSLAIALGAAGRDPRRVAGEALRLNPLEGMAQDAVLRFDTESPRVWRRRARSSSLPLPAVNKR